MSEEEVEAFLDVSFDRLKTVVAKSKFGMAVVDAVKREFAGCEVVHALGLGDLSRGNGIRQLALLMCIMEVLPSVKVFAFDPSFSKCDARVLDLLGIHHEEKWKDFACSSHQRALFYMPHCPFELYDDVLRIQQQKKSFFMILGNDLRAYQYHLEMFSEASALKSLGPKLQRVGGDLAALLQRNSCMETAFSNLNLQKLN